MIVYRIEHENGIGPYWNYNENKNEELRKFAELISDKHSDAAHPLADMDCGYMAPHYVCGFLSREQYKRWFRGFRKKLRELGYMLCHYEVPTHAIKIGTYQIVFSKILANRIAVEQP